jgi:four helix bundle protein
MLEAYVVSQSLIRSLRTIVPAIKKNDRDLADQLRRAATSVLLNIGEGEYRAGGDRRHHFEIAAGSANEVRACLDAADAWGWTVDDSEARMHLKRVQGMLWGLVHGPKHLRQGDRSALAQ